eukprot:6275615-Pyramimonas_sp.AAC.1
MRDSSSWSPKVRFPEGDPRGAPAERPEQTAAQAARAAAASANRAVEILQADGAVQQGAAAFNTVNQLGGLLQSLQWQLHNVPEGIRALANVQEVLDMMVAQAQNAQETPNQLQEGMLQIHQGV